MTIIEQIKAEIDKRYAEYREKMKSDDFTYYEGMADALDLFEQFLDSLESEPMNLEEEISRTYHDGSVTDTSDLDHVSCENIARHFAQWGAEHAREKIMEGPWKENFCTSHIQQKTSSTI